MVALSRRIITVLTPACGLAAMLAVAQPGPAAAAGDDEGTQPERTGPCIVGHRFEPGPIVEGHYRQPTPREFEARMRELRALSQRSSCFAQPLASTAGDETASGTRPASALATSGVANGIGSGVQRERRRPRPTAQRECPRKSG
jgi:hypothetical protein